MISGAARRLRAVVYGAGLALLVALLTPLWLAHHFGTRLARSRRTGTTTEIPRRPAGDVDLRTVLDEGRPLIVEGLVDELGLSGVATPEHLAAIAGDHTIQVTDHDADRPYFLYSGGYDVTVQRRQETTVDDLLQRLFVDGVDDGTVVYQLFGINSLGGEIRGVLERVDDAVRPRVGRATEPRFSGVWVGSPGAVTPLHHDAWPGLLLQTHGRKRLVMYAPDDRTNLYFRSPLHGEGRWSMLPGRSADASPDEFGRLDRAVRWVGELRPGDVLHIPAFWAHEMEASTANISIPFRFASTATTYLNPGFLRPASEMLRKQLRVAAGR